MGSTGESEVPCASVEEIITSAKPAISSRNGRGRIGVAVPGGFRVFSALVPSFPKYHGFVAQGVFNVGWIRILCGTKCQVVEQLPDSNKTLSI